MDNYLFKLSRNLIVTFSLLLGISFFTSTAYADKREVTKQLSAKPAQVAYYGYHRYGRPYYRPYGYYRNYGPRYYHRNHYRYW